ncbi:hypothetical protein BGZ65_000024, partial [Modicella reniformis]
MEAQITSPKSLRFLKTSVLAWEAARFFLVGPVRVEAGIARAGGAGGAGGGAGAGITRAGGGCTATGAADAAVLRLK